MAAVVPTAPQQLSINKLQPDLASLFCDKGLSWRMQAALSENGYATMGVFRLLAGSMELVRAALAAEYNLDPDENGIAVEIKRSRRIETARVLDA